MADRTVLVRLQANIADFKAQMDQASKSVEGVGKKSQQSEREASTALGRLTRSAQDNRQAWDTAGTALTGFGLATVGALGATVRAAVQWESAWAGVTKTVSGTPGQLAQVEAGLRGLSRVMPSSQGEIAAVAEAAGQLGVKTKDVVGFTKTMIDLGETTNLTADEAATSLAQLMNVMRTAPEDVGRLGASLVALGNAGASTEADILNMASYITGSAKLIGASESDVLALANAMTSMGINAERGGGVMTRVMQDIYTAVQSGGEQLEGFAQVAGMSSAEFARAFEADPIRAVDSFIQGLNGVEASGGNVVATLSELGYKGTQDTAVLLQMKGAGDLLTQSLDLGNQAWAENTALVEEAAKRYDTTAARLEIARNNINDAAIVLGEAFLPAVAGAAEGAADLATWVGQLPEPLLALGGQLAGVAGAAGLAGGAFLLVFPRVIDTVKSFRDLRDISPGVADGLSNVGKAAGALTVLGALAAAADALSVSLDGPAASMEEITRALLAMESTGGASVDAIFNDFSILTTSVDDLESALNRSSWAWYESIDGMWSKIPLLGDMASGTKKLEGAFADLGESLAFMVQSGNAEQAAAQFDAIVAAENRAADADGRKARTTRELLDLFPAYRDSLIEVENQQALTAESGTALAGASQAAAGAISTIPGAAEGAYASLVAYAEYLGLDEDATQALIDTSRELGETLVGFVDPLGTYTGYLDAKIAKEQEAAGQTDATGAAGQAAWQQFADGAGVSIEQYLSDLEEQLAAQENWQVNMLRLAGRVSQGTLDELARMGPEGAPLVADLVNASDAELDRFDDVTRRRSKEATDAWGEQLTLAQPVLAAIGARMGQEVVDDLAEKLRNGTTTVAQIASQYGVELANGINPVLGALGRREIHLRSGRGYQAYAQGGIEDHTAQIAPAGAWRVWAEDETGGEAYIPLAPGKRRRSVDIWREVGDRLGVQFEEYAYGGIRDVPRPRSTAPYRPPISTGGDASMQRLYEEVTGWLEDNLEPPSTSGIQGTGGGSSAGLVTFGRRLQAMGARVAEHPAFGGVAPVHTRNSAHYRGAAIDVNTRPGTSALEQRELAPMAALARQAGFKTIFMAPGHYGHLHVQMAKGGILNPHVRDAGGPLLPGYTFNGTGANEVVLPQRFFDALPSPVPAGAGAGAGSRPVEQHNHYYDVDPAVAAARNAVELERMLR